MKSLLRCVMIALPTTAFAVDNPYKYRAYKERLAARKTKALEQRRIINASRPPARGWLAIHRPDIDIKSPIVPLDWGVISQPAIPMQPVVATPYYESYNYATVPVPSVSRPVTVVGGRCR